MTEPIRVMLVDDSVVVRRALTTALESEPDFKVTATAANGQLALTRLETTTVDAVVLDIEMPELDGLSTLRRIRAKWPDLPVVMCSTLTERGAAVTIDALAAGATDYVTKPSAKENYAASLAALREELGRKLRDIVRPTSGAVRPSLRPTVTSPGLPVAPAHPLPTPRILAIACSTGGPNALLDLWRGLPRPFPAPIVIVQHMPPIFTRMLGERLTALGGIVVKEGEHGERLVPGEARIAPGGRHMEVVGPPDAVTIRLHDGEPENSCRPAADVLFRSVARLYRNYALGVVLTGMGQDALVGSRAICDAGGSVIVQDELTSVVWGMPGFVARAGLAREIAPLSEMPSAVLRSFRLPHTSKSRDGNSRDRLPLRT